MATRDGAASDSIQDLDDQVLNIDQPPSAGESQHERPDRSDTYPTTRNFVDPPHNDSSSQSTQLTPIQTAHECQELIGHPTETTQHQNTTQDASRDVDANLDTEGAPAIDLETSALPVEEEDKDDCDADAEIPEEPASNTNQLDRFMDRYDYFKKYPKVTIEPDHSAALALLAQRLGGATPTQTTTRDPEQNHLGTPNASAAERGLPTQQNDLDAPTRTPEFTPRQTQYLPGSNNPPLQVPRVKLGEVVQSLDVVDLDPNDIDTFVAIPYEATTSIEKQAERPPGKPSRATRPFILRRFAEAQKSARLASHTETNTFADRYDYLKKYPQDASEEAMGPNARVWHVYLDEVEQFDIDMIDNFRDTVDVMLVFAGLFSAVVTTFVAQASTALQTDYNQVTASAALEQLAIQRAYYSGLPIPEPSSSTLSLDSSTTMVTDRWVNGLWFTSLSFSLATALFAVLVKQWIQAYVSPVSGSIQTRVRVRQYRYLGLERWHVYGIIGLLPTLLHLSLFLFLAGLTVFLFALDSTIAKVTTSIAGSAAAIYIFTHLAPVFSSQCPYKTPLSTYALSLLYPSLTRLKSATQSARRILLEPPKAEEILKAWAASIFHAGHTLFGFFRSRSCSKEEAKASPLAPRTSASGFMKKIELNDISLISDTIDAEALCWVVTWSSNPSVRTVVVEAAGDLRSEYQEEAKDILRDGGVADAACASIQMCTAQSGFEYPYLRAVLAHFQLGLYGSFGMTRNCRCIGSLSPFSHRDAGGGLGQYFSLLLESWRGLVHPQHILWSSAHTSPNIAFLHILRQAVLSLRTSPPSRSRDHRFDWTSCQKLLALVQFEPFPADLFGRWQTTLVSVYLASLVSELAPISENSGLLFKLLLNHIELGSSELSQALATELSVKSCIQFLGHMLENPIAATDFSSSDEGSQFIKQLSSHFDSDPLSVSDSDKHVIGPCHTLLVALLDNSEKHDGSISAGLRMLIYNLGYSLMARDVAQSSDPEPDTDSLFGRLLRAALIPPQLSGPYKLLESQILCVRNFLRDSPPKNRSVLLDIFKEYDGVNILEKLIRSAGSQLVGGHRAMIRHSLDFYLKEVSPTGESSPPSPETDITQHGGQSDSNGQDHLGYILRHLVQIIRICVACHSKRISYWRTDSYPDTLHILRRLVETGHEASPEWNHALAELESQGFALPVSWRTQYAESNLQEIISILRSDLGAARSPGAPDLSQPEPLLPPRSSASIVSEAAEPNPGLTLEATVGEESQHPTTRAESIVLRSTRRFQDAIWRVIAARRVAAGAIIPLHTRAPFEQVHEHGPRHSAELEGESMIPHRDGEKGLSTTRPT